MYDPRMAADPTFPADLIALRRDFIQAGRELQALPADDQGRRTELRDRERDLAVQLSGHPHWRTCEGDPTEAKFALHRVSIAELDAG